MRATNNNKDAALQPPCGAHVRAGAIFAWLKLIFLCEVMKGCSCSDTGAALFLALDAVTAVSRSYKRNKEIGLIFLFT